MITTFYPIRKISYYNIFDFEITGGKTIINMILFFKFFGMKLCGFCFFAKVFFEEIMIATLYAFVF